VAAPPRPPWDVRAGDAADIQRRLTPHQLHYPGLEIAVRCEPLEEVGGDFVDAVTMPDGRLLLVVADVCGNGLPAALVAMSLHGIVRCCAQDGYSLGEIAERLNGYLQFSHSDGPFVTMACVAIDLLSGACEAINAGHPPLLVIQPQGSVRRLTSGGTFPLGIATITARTATDVIAPDDVMLVYSDGWTELYGHCGQMLGITGLTRSVASVCRDCSTAPLDEVLNAVHVHLAKFQGRVPAQDDRTLMLVRRRSVDHGRPSTRETLPRASCTKGHQPWPRRT
jgi:serine phosphatase RsbU (regulator of sigma subunit)